MDRCNACSASARFPRLARAWLWALPAAFGLLMFSFRFLDPDAEIGDRAPIGNVAAGLADGLASSVWHYQCVYNTGSMLFGVLLYPVYAWCGSSFLWLKMLSACFLIGGIIFWALALGRIDEPPVRLLFVLWAVFPPPFLASTYFAPYAIHIESLFFLGLLLYLFTRMPNDGPRFGETSMFGFVGGFAVFFSPENLPFVAAAATVAGLRWRRHGVFRLLWPGAVAFAIGLSPVLMSPDYPRTIEMGQVDVAGRLAVCAARWWNLFFRILPFCAGYRGIAGNLLTMAWPLLIAGGVAVVFREIAAKKNKLAGPQWTKLLLVFHLFFFFAALGFSIKELDLDTLAGTRYFATLSLSFFTLASLFLARLRPYQKWLVMTPFLLSGFANIAAPPGLHARVLVEGWRQQRTHRGDDYRRLVGDDLASRWRSREEAFAEVAKLPCRWRPEGYVAIGRRLATDDFVAIVQDDSRPEFARLDVAIGQGLRLAQFLADRGAPPAFASASPPEPDVSRMGTVEKNIALAATNGMGRGILDEKIGARLPAFMLSTPRDQGQLQREAMARAAEFSAYFPQLTEREFSLALARGFGVWFGYAAGLDDDAIRAARSVVEAAFHYAEDAEARATFRQGFMAGLATRIKNTFNRFQFKYHSIDFPVLRDALAEQGVLCQPCSSHANEYDLAPIPCASPKLVRP
jgi:hypothetical protein